MYKCHWAHLDCMNTIVHFERVSLVLGTFNKGTYTYIPSKQWSLIFAAPSIKRAWNPGWPLCQALMNKMWLKPCLPSVEVLKRSCSFCSLPNGILRLPQCGESVSAVPTEAVGLQRVGKAVFHHQPQLGAHMPAAAWDSPAALSSSSPVKPQNCEK